VIEAYLAELANRLTARVGDRLLGAWVIGSGALGDFDAQRSDIDVQAVSAERLPRAELEALAAELSHEALPCPLRGLEFVLYAREDLHDPRGPAFSLNLNSGPGMEHHAGFDAEVEPRFWFVLDVAIARAHSRALTGLEPTAVLPPLPRELVSASLRDSLEWFRAHDAGQAVLAACRAWAWATDGRWLSKGEAAGWAMARLDDPAPVADALRRRVDPAAPGPAPAGAAALIDSVDRMLEPGSEELHQTGERLQAVIESAPVGILEVDLDTRVIRWNPAAERIFGWSREEILGRVVPLVPDAKRAEFEEVLATVRSGRVFPNVETYRQRKDGSLVEVEIAAAPVRDRAGKVVSHMVVFTDITKRKRQERELRASRARIVEAGDAERRRLERNLHDGAQQRLVSVSLLLRLVAGRLDADPADIRRELERIGEELTLALAELRELARGLHPAILSDKGLAVALESLAGRAPVPVRIRTAPLRDLPEAIEAASYYVIAEALTNVAKYAQATQVDVDIAFDNGSMVIEVSDDGVGGAALGGGSGLRGLTDRVEALGGQLDVRSRRGSGTSLRAEIPL
jgi:PAS domain S-box-containing protein